MKIVAIYAELKKTYFFSVCPIWQPIFFLDFYNELELGAGIDPGMVLTPYLSIILESSSLTTGPDCRPYRAGFVYIHSECNWKEFETKIISLGEKVSFLYRISTCLYLFWENSICSTKKCRLIMAINHSHLAKIISDFSNFQMHKFSFFNAGFILNNIYTILKLCSLK